MTYDLNFYKAIDNPLTRADLTSWLIRRFGVADDEGHWLVAHDEVDVNFTLSLPAPGESAANVTFPTSPPGFVATNLSFSLNFLRPDFFGTYAFSAIDAMIAELNLFVNEPDNEAPPRRPEPGQLCEKWLKKNTGLCTTPYLWQLSRDSGTAPALFFYPKEASDLYYHYMVRRAQMEKDAKGEYFVPKLFLVKRKSDNSVFSMTTWTNHIPTIIPPADYFLIQKKSRKFFRAKEETGLIRGETMLERLGHLLSNFDCDGCRIMRAGDAQVAANLFNALPLEPFDSNAVERASTQGLVNHQPE